MYGKITDGILRYAPRTISYEGKTIANPPEEILLKIGYLPVVRADRWETDNDHYIVSHWEEQENKIVEVLEEKEITEDERTLDEKVDDLIKSQLNQDSEIMRLSESSMS